MTETEVNVILECISLMPTNLTAAFEYASQKIDRTPGAISGYYYGHLKHSDRKMMITGSNQMIVVNSKNTARNPEVITLMDIVEQHIPKLNKKQRMELINLLMR